MEKNNLTPEESFTIINKAIANFKMNYKEASKIFLLWGWILALASLSNFVILRILHIKEAYNLMGVFSLGNWAAFALVGFLIMFFVNRRTKKHKKVYTQLDRYFNHLWIVSASSFFIATLVCIKLEIAPPPIMLLIAGLATTTSGLFIKFKPVIFGGIAFFIFSIASTFVANEYIALIVFASIICGYIIPGYFLKSAKE
ncbi:MAG: hypothetical protein K9H26_17815 [Prolixibacteraceae bacterium]|nr:hypothetical protein [Prolixibacteraceae bacterium]